MKNPLIIRQGDVCLVQVAKLPEGCVEIPPEGGRIVLKHGEVTGHAHAIADHHPANWNQAGDIAGQAIGLAGRRARLLQAKNGARYLEVAKAVTLCHEEHTAHRILAGIYELPVQMQMEHTIARKVRPVRD